MVVPLQVLAAGAAVVGLLGVPAVLGEGVGIVHFLDRFMEPSFEDAGHRLAELFLEPVPGHGAELGLMALSIFIALAGIWVATRFYRGEPVLPERLAAAWPGVYRTLLNKYWVDELYGAVFVRGLTLGGGNALFATDRYVVDGGDGEVRPALGVNGVAWTTRDLLAKASNLWDRWVVDGAVNLTAFVLDNMSYAFRAVQNGLVQHYALGMLIGIFLLIFAGRFLLGLY
jgi:NADH-quinone oxidoreductase subunit L